MFVACATSLDGTDQRLQSFCCIKPTERAQGIVISGMGTASSSDDEEDEGKAPEELLTGEVGTTDIGAAGIQVGSQISSKDSMARNLPLAKFWKRHARSKAQGLHSTGKPNFVHVIAVVQVMFEQHGKLTARPSPVTSFLITEENKNFMPRSREVHGQTGEPEICEGMMK